MLLKKRNISVNDRLCRIQRHDPALIGVMGNAVGTAKVACLRKAQVQHFDGSAICYRSEIFCILDGADPAGIQGDRKQVECLNQKLCQLPMFGVLSKLPQGLLIQLGYSVSCVLVEDDRIVEDSVVKDEISIAFNDAKFLLKSKAGIPMDIFLRKIWAESLGDRGEIYRVNHDSLPALLSFYKNGSPFLFWHRK